MKEAVAGGSNGDERSSDGIMKSSCGLYRELKAAYEYSRWVSDQLRLDGVCYSRFVNGYRGCYH